MPSLSAGLICLLALSGAEETVTLARDARPAATIVLPHDAPVPLAAAAADLQTYVRRICGVELPLRRDGQRVPGTGLYLGRCEPTTEADLPSETLPPETYALRVRNGSVFFTGRYPTPACFAVESFLEEVLGVRWFAPGDLWEYVPQGQAGELVVRVCETVKTPSTSPRVWSGHDWYPDWKTWNLRNKTVLSEVVPRRQFQNCLFRVFPPEKYGKTHPEYYPLIHGKRYIPGADHHWRPCESNPDVQRLTVEYLRAWFDAHPDVDSFSLGMDDISHLCSCENCRAMDPHPDSYEKKEFSDRHYQFVNAVAREVRRTHPDRYVGTLIYNIARRLPETVPALEDNVFGFLTEESASWWRPGIKDFDHELTRQWAQRCKHLSRYDYYGLGTMTPRTYPHTMAEQIQFDKAMGLEGMYIEVYTFLPHTAPMIWSLAKLQWDDTLDIDRLLGEFYTKMYGPAAPAMKRYFDLLERSWNTPRPGRGAWCHRNLVAQAQAMSGADVDAAFALLREAASAANDGPICDRIEIHRAALEYSSFPIYAYDLSQQLSQLAITDAASADRALKLIARLDDVASRREGCWQAAAGRQDLLGETVRGLGPMKSYLAGGQFSRLVQGGAAAALRLLAWCAQHDPDRLAKLGSSLDNENAGDLLQTVRAWRWVQANPPRSLLVNGDLRRPARPGDGPATFPGWSTWSRTSGTQFAMLSDPDPDHARALSISGAEAASYTQGVKAKAGQKYLCLADVKVEPADDFGEARLGIRFRTNQGWWAARRGAEPSVSAVGGTPGWQTLCLLASVPEGATELVVMPGVSAQPTGARACFANLRLYPVP